MEYMCNARCRICIIVLCSGEVRGGGGWGVSHPDLSHAEQTLRAVQYSFFFFEILFCYVLSLWNTLYIDVIVLWHFLTLYTWQQFSMISWRMPWDGILGGFSICPPDISTTSIFNYPHYTFNYNHNCYNNSSHLILSGGVSKFNSNSTDFVSTQFSFFLLRFTWYSRIFHELTANQKTRMTIMQIKESKAFDQQNS